MSKPSTSPRTCAVLFALVFFSALSKSAAIPVANPMNDALDAVQVSAKGNPCCIFPESDWGTDVKVTGGSVKTGGAQKLSFSFSAGGVISAVISTPTMVFKCGSGKTIKAASKMCGAMPISDDSQGWNAVGFEGTPTLQFNLFGFKFDVLGELRKWDDTKPEDKDKVLTTQQQIGIAAKAIHNGGGKAVCAAYQTGLFPAACGGGFAMAQNGFLKAECGLNPAGTVIVCPALPNTPKITFELINFGLSPKRDLEQEAFISFWNGDKSVKDMVLTSSKFVSKGVVSMMGKVSFTAFQLKIGADGFDVQATITGAVTLDIRLPSLSQIKAAFSALASGDFDKLFGKTGRDVLPGFQITISGQVHVTCDLKVFKLSFTPGTAGLTFGFNMGSDYKGFSDGLYMAAVFTVTLLNLVPPLSNSFFKCNGKNIFENISFTRAAGLYMSFSKGIGFGMTIQLNILSFSASADFLVTNKKTSFAMGFSCTIGDYTLAANVELGFTYSGSGISPFITGRYPSIGEVISAAQSGLRSIWDSLLKTIRGWVGLAEQEFLQWKAKEDEKLQALLQSSAHVDSQKQKPQPVLMSRNRRLLGSDAAKALDDAHALDDAQVKAQSRARWGHRHHWHHPHRHHWHHRHHNHHWHHRHHNHHWHHRHHRWHVHHRHAPHWHAAALWNAAKPSLIFEVRNADFQLNICGLYVHFRIEAGASLWGLKAKQEIEIKIHITPGSILQKMKDMAISAFNALKNSIASLVGQYRQEEYYEQQAALLLQIEQRTGKKYVKAKGQFSETPLRQKPQTTASSSADPQ
jgi:hypothetical protein